ncbi:MAG: deoxyribonuclease IV [Athalassotoga sp.]|uniref:deoxyribonuclease IV n=1 Tax=Athalassotoga sp. TaxID=2022597 RepID=UPI003D07C9DE
MYIGAHMTSPLSTIPQRTIKIGGNTFQIFSHSPRMWKVNVNSNDDERELFKQEMKKYGIENDKVMIHASYLINLASPNEEVLNKSIELMKKELELANLLNIKYVNVHPGSGLGEDEEKSIQRIANSISTIMKNRPENVELLLELVSPKGGNIGHNFYQLKKIADLSGCDLYFTYDTCHGFDAGYDITSKDGMKKLMNEIDSTIGRDRLVMCHLNDSMYPLGVHKDRHERIGKGFIGKKGFETFFSEEFFRTIPMVLETPGDDPEHEEDIRVVKEIIEKVIS